MIPFDRLDWMQITMKVLDANKIAIHALHAEDPKHCMGLDSESSDIDHINCPPTQDCDYTTAILSKLRSDTDTGKLLYFVSRDVWSHQV